MVVPADDAGDRRGEAIESELSLLLHELLSYSCKYKPSQKQ